MHELSNILVGVFLFPTSDTMLHPICGIRAYVSDVSMCLACHLVLLDCPYINTFAFNTFFDAVFMIKE